MVKASRAHGFFPSRGFTQACARARCSRDHLGTESVWSKVPPLYVPVSPSPGSHEASRVALDRPFDDSRVHTANVAVSASTLSANTIYDLIYMFRAERPLYFRYFRLDKTTEADVSDSEGGGRQQSFTQAAPNELKLGDGGFSGESWPSAWRWRRGVRRREGRRTNEEADSRAVVELKPDFNTMKVCHVENTNK